MDIPGTRPMYTGRQLLLVAYYLESPEEILSLIDDFESRCSLSHDHVLIVNNSNRQLPHNLGCAARNVQVLQGTNHFWEFSGWTEGLRTILASHKPRIVTLLNDSYRKNWNITPASQGEIRRMIRTAEAGIISGWRDLFGMWAPPHFSRRPNSRLCFAPGHLLAELLGSLELAMAECRKRLDAGTPLFNTIDQRKLRRWLTIKNGRWDSHATDNRLQRIFVEHHMFDHVAPHHLRLYPRNLLTQGIYSVLRRTFRESR